MYMYMYMYIYIFRCTDYTLSFVFPFTWCRPDDNRFDHRPFLYRVTWPWQFRAIDRLVEMAG